VSANRKVSGGGQFRWRGRDTSGQIHTGVLAAASERAARVALHRRGITVQTLRRQAHHFVRRRRPPPGAQAVNCLRQLAVAVDSGLPLLTALDMLQDAATHLSLRNMLKEIRQEVAAGSSLARALGAYPNVFDESTCQLIAGGEQSGNPGPMLRRAVEYWEESLRLRRRIRQAMLYPAVITIVAAVVTAVMLLKVVPKFALLFADFGTELPAATRLVIRLSEGLAAAWLPGAVLIAAAAAVFALAWQYPLLRGWRDRQLLRLPLAGPLLQKSAVARFCRVAGAALEAGMPAAEALQTAGSASANRALETAVAAVSERLIDGQSLYAALREETAILPPIVASMAAVGEQSGQLPQMLNLAAGRCEEDVQVLTGQLIALLEPLAIAILGVLAGGLIVSMYLPVFQLGGIA